MKIRQGFVSNSSSSSFIIGIAKVADIDKCKKYIKENDISEDNYDGVNIVTFKDIKENKIEDIEKVTQDEILIESFCYSTVHLETKDLKDEDNVLVYYFCGNEGDGCFMDDEDDWGDYDYDIDTNFFDKTEQKVIDMLSDPEAAGLENCDWTFGAERNG